VRRTYVSSFALIFLAKIRPITIYLNLSKLCLMYCRSFFCSFDKHGLILVIFGKQHQHTFKNDMHVQFSLSLHFYLLYLVLNSYDRITVCDGRTDEQTSHDGIVRAMLCPQLSTRGSAPGPRWRTSIVNSSCTASEILNVG